MAFNPGPGSRHSVDDIPEWRSVTPDLNSLRQNTESPVAGGNPKTQGNAPVVRARSQQMVALKDLPDGPQLFQQLITDDEEERVFVANGLVEIFSESLEALKANYWTISRYAYECPMSDLRQVFLDLLEANKPKLNFPTPQIRCSTFIPQFAIPSIEDPALREQFEEIFLATGRVSHLDRVCSMHPTYLEKGFATFSILMQGTGPLGTLERLYLGILGAARFECPYFVDLLEFEFLQSGGDPAWLMGTQHVPPKIKAILEINAILAHRPWLIRQTHFEVLLRSNTWSVAELVHAVLILATSRSIAATVLGCGITPELDSLTLQQKIDATALVPESPPPEPDFSEETQKLQQLLQSEAFARDDLDEGEMADIAARLSEFEKIAQETETPPAFDINELGLSRYNECNPLRHVDFEMKTNKLLLVQDFSWAEQGYEMVKRYFPAMADPLDDQFNHIENLTYNSFNSEEDINTFPFRRALWFYVQRVKGVFFDDYNYQTVNSVLHRNIKSFVKKISCYPATITLRDFNNFGVKLDSSEKVHVALLASEAAKQAELLWALDSISLAASKPRSSTDQSLSWPYN